jgi:hypothetical protein
LEKGGALRIRIAKRALVTLLAAPTASVAALAGAQGLLSDEQGGIRLNEHLRVT